MIGSKSATPAIRPPYDIARLRRPAGACYCDHDDRECYNRGHWQPTTAMFKRGHDWYLIGRNGQEIRLLDHAPNLERQALCDPAHVAARERAAVPDPRADDEWPDNALDTF